MASANVRTLLPHQEDTSYSRTSAALMMSSAQLLEQQFIESGLEVIGLQEGRSRHAVERSGFAYKMLASCADHGGQYGNQLWFSFKSRFQIVTWRTVSPRIMFAVLTRSQIAYAFIVAHGPTEAATPDTKRKWWELLDTTVREIKKKHPDAPPRDPRRHERASRLWA